MIDAAYEECSRCGVDHELEPELAQEIHRACSLCREEMSTCQIGEGPDHLCEDHVLAEPEL